MAIERRRLAYLKGAMVTLLSTPGGQDMLSKTTVAGVIGRTTIKRSQLRLRKLSVDAVV